MFSNLFLREMCSDRCKIHCCTQKISEGTSSAMFNLMSKPLPKAANTSDVLRLNLMLREFASYCVTINTGAFLGKMCSDRRKNHGCGQKKPEGTSSARFGLRTVAKCGELKR